MKTLRVMSPVCAVSFGALWRDAGLPIGAAVCLALGIGLLGGALNALLIARFRITPLIVTLGTYSLFRGIAEGLTGGAVNYTGFPRSFLFLGQGYLFGRPEPLQRMGLRERLVECVGIFHGIEQRI